MTSQQLCKYILNDNTNGIRNYLKSKSKVNEIISSNNFLECSTTVEGKVAYWLAIGLRKYDIVVLLTENLLANKFEWSQNDFGYKTLSKLLEYMDLSAFDEVKSLYIQTTEMNLWEQEVEEGLEEKELEEKESEEPTELDENIGWENENDEDVSELHFEQYEQILEYLLSVGIMNYDTIATSDILCKAAYVKIYDAKFSVLRRLLPFYKAPLNTDFIINGAKKPIISIAVDTPSFELLELLIDSGYDVNDFTITLYNPIYETWFSLFNAKLEKKGTTAVYTKMYDFLVPKEDQSSYSRGCNEFLAIYTGQFTILEASYLNSFKKIKYISKSRYRYFQTLLSVCQNEIVADAVLSLNGLNLTEQIPLGDGEIGIAAQVVPPNVLNVILPELKENVIEGIIPYFIRKNKEEQLIECLIYLDSIEPNSEFLTEANLRKIGLNNTLYRRYITARDINRQSEECCLCSTKTMERLQCGHFTHYECLAKCSSTKCPYCKEEQKLPEEFAESQKRRLAAEKERNLQEWTRRYIQLEQQYGEEIPPNLLFDLDAEFLNK